ncbi:MAG: carbohydrate binding family 9 domain-containing protein [Rhodothermales bacterium]|nr:carbohydrate binding family 9 domain-containing protein [Rhodothermales bacterium]MBO6781186.1 carbohydrate binding family 9 domain-containing protein [Rhodothermales bacterium]
MRAVPVLILTGMLTHGALAQAPEPVRTEAVAHYAETAPRIDGILDDAIWASIPPVTDFRQRWPEEGAEPTERSEMRIAFDEDHLYFGFRFFDSEPDQIRANIFERGGRIDKDDNIWITIDTYDDDRNAYLFEMNPLGTQDDATITDESMSMDDWSWDSVYYSEGNIDEEGWTLEVAIPFRQIRFSKEDRPLMGLAVERRINRKNERVIWPFIPRSYTAGILAVSQYGSLRGLENLRRGKNIEVKPYVITGAQESRPDLAVAATESEVTRDLGIDMKYGITSNLTLDLTVNTDFAQVEADAVQINLTRFNLFFPEKREFFLERSGLFTHGAARNAQTFFSRRIGIANEILAGARLTGQVGRFSVGLLNIQTKRDRVLDAPATNNAVARVRTSLTPRTTLGGIVTNFDQGERYNRAFGVDLQRRFWSSSSVEAWFTRVQDSMPDLDGGTAGEVQLRLANDLYSGSAGFRSVSSSYAPALGFVARRDIRRYTADVAYSPLFRSERHPIRRMVAGTGVHYITGQDGEKQSWSWGGVANFQLERRDRFSVELNRSFERLDRSFFIRPDAEILTGDYYENTVSVRGGTDPSRRGFLQLGASRGGFFGGTRYNLNGGAGFRQSRYLKLETGFSYSNIDLPIEGGSFDATTVSLGIQAATGRKLFANALVQYDNFSRDVRANIRVDWIHKPGSDLFLVINTNYHVTEPGEDIFDPRRDVVMNNQLGVAKLTYLILL